MKKVVVIIAHPNLRISITTKEIVENLKNKNEAKAGQILFRNLIELYPDYKIDKRAEQEALLWADIVVLQFPFYWYNVPGILKTWMDEVFEFGFAFGKTGDKMKGKHLVLSFSTGGSLDAYAHGARNNYEIDELLYPIKQTSNLMGTIWEQPIVSFGMANIPGLETDNAVTIQKAKLHAEKLFATLKKID